MTTSQGGNYGHGGRSGGGRRVGGGRRRRSCLCKDADKIDYKDVSILRRFITDRGRIEPRVQVGNCAKCQRRVRQAIERARFMALLPYSGDHLRVTGILTPPSSEKSSDTPEVASEESSDTPEVASEESSDTPSKKDEKV